MAEDGDTEAHYEYAPFGAVIAQRGASAAANPWRFSSEYAEDDTVTVYYNYRHYEPVVGRWLSRDPIGEMDAPCLYGFIRNRANLVVDKDGLMEVSEEEEQIRRTMTFKNGQYVRRVNAYFVEILDKYSTYEFYLTVSGRCREDESGIGDPEVTIGEETGHNLVNEPDYPAIATLIAGYTVSWRLSRSNSSYAKEREINGKKCKVNTHTIVWHLYRETSISFAVGIGPFAAGFGWSGLFPDSREVATLREEFTKTCCCEDKRGLSNE